MKIRLLLSLVLALSATTLLLGGCGSESSDAEGDHSGEEHAGDTAETTAETGGTDTSATEGDHSLPGDADAGEAIYAANCVACHAANGEGNGGMTGADFVNDATRLAKNNETLLTSIRDGVTTGSQPMPAQGANLSEDEMNNVLSYIRREFGGTH